MGTALATDGREAHGDGALGVLLEEFRETEVVHGVGADEAALCATALCVDYALRNALAVEVGEQVDQVEVLEEQRTVLADSLRLVGVRHGNAICGCVKCFLRWLAGIVFVC